MDYFQSEFENLIEKNLKKELIKEFPSIAEICNIENMDKVGIFAEDEGELYLIDFNSLSSSLQKLRSLIKKEIKSKKLSLYQNNYYNMIKEELDKAKIKEDIKVKQYEEEDKRTIELTGYEFRIKRLEARIQKIINEAKKSLDFDFMYINKEDKDTLEANGIISRMSKDLDIAINVEPSKCKTHHIDLENHNRITVTTCDVDKYNVLSKVVHEIEEIVEEANQFSKLKFLYDSERGLLYVDSKAYKSSQEYIETLYEQLENNRSEWLEFKMNLPNYPMRVFLNNLIVFLGKKENREHIHLCLTKT